MITKYDLYDISAAFVLIRADIKSESNSEVIKSIVDVLQNVEVMYEENQIRKAIQNIDNLDRERWQFVFHLNVYVNHDNLKNSSIYAVLISACKRLLKTLSEKNYEEAYDLVDCIHCLPEIIADNRFEITKTFWNANIKEYRHKWDKDFLVVEQKALA